MSQPPDDRLKALWQGQDTETPEMTAIAIRALARNYGDNLRGRIWIGVTFGSVFAVSYVRPHRLGGPERHPAASADLIIMAAWPRMIVAYRLTSAGGGCRRPKRRDLDPGSDRLPPRPGGASGPACVVDGGDGCCRSCLGMTVALVGLPKAHQAVSPTPPADGPAGDLGGDLRPSAAGAPERSGGSNRSPRSTPCATRRNDVTMGEGDHA